ncbi:MAG: beta-galactosidase, partial [Cellulophaga sp.]|nr:beta-galactosidase [Cellulophaga sp.]
MLKYYVPIFCILLLISSCNQKAQNNLERSKTNINENWSYLEKNSEDIEAIKNQENWININLPHTWNNEDVTDNEPGYRRSSSWYKKMLTIENVVPNQHYLLYFEGSNITTKVYVNGKEAGEHIGGYIGFTIDITDYIKNGENELLVHVDNGYDPHVIPSQKSDFFIYGGITRDVWLVTKPETHIGKVQVQTPEVSEKNASLKLTIPVEILNNISGLSLKVALVNPIGIEVTTKTIESIKNINEILISDIQNPKLWDTKNPNLYSVIISLKKDKKNIDEVSEKVGFRWFEFEKNGPFYLNGKRLLLRGTHRHEEHAGVGAAVSNDQHRKDMEQMKGMGVNFIRLAH